jgi:hypothetical protein
MSQVVELRVHFTHLFTASSLPECKQPCMKLLAHISPFQCQTYECREPILLSSLCLNGVVLEHIRTQRYRYLTHCTGVRLYVSFSLRRVLMKHRREDLKESRNPIRSVSEMFGQISNVSSSHKNKYKNFIRTCVWEWMSLQFNWKITFSNEYHNSVTIF